MMVTEVPAMRRLVFLGLLYASRAFSYDMDDITRIAIEVKDPKTGEVYYTGKEEISQDGKADRRETVYYDSAKKEVEKEVVVYDRDSLHVSDYSYKNTLTGEESTISASADEAKISHRESEGRKAKEKTLKIDRNSYFGKVVSYLILRNWKALNNNKIYKFNLILPSRLETIPFQIVHRKSYQKDGENREIFALIPQNILIRTLAPHLELEFSSGDKPLPQQLLAPSPLPIKGQKDKMVYFSFSYPPTEKAKDKEKAPVEAAAAAPANPSAR
jgi:hypothetical protein